MNETLQNFLDESVAAFRSYKTQAEKAAAQVSDDEFFRAIDAEANSIAAIMKHLGGNLRSRWTDFLTSDGEKPDRDRDSEFVTETDTRADIESVWNVGFETLFAALEALKPEDLSRLVRIRTESFTVTRAVLRSLGHTSSHIGQIVLLAKHFRAENWQTLSIPRNKSAAFGEYLANREEKGDYLQTAGEFAEREGK